MSTGASDARGLSELSATVLRIENYKKLLGYIDRSAVGNRCTFIVCRPDAGRLPLHQILRALGLALQKFDRQPKSLRRLVYTKTLSPRPSVLQDVPAIE
jgi:hypothetical protein